MPTEYPNTPEGTWQGFFDCLSKKDWKRMPVFVQKTWQAETANQAEILETMYGGLNPGSTNIYGVEYISPVMADITVDAFSQKTKVRVICETACRKPSIRGVWGINLFSFRKE